MRSFTIAFALPVAFLAASSAAFSQTEWLSIPSSAFTPQSMSGNQGYAGNRTGTARLFGSTRRMFAPVNLPHGSTIIELQCGGGSPNTRSLVVVTLWRNEPQQENLLVAGPPVEPRVGFQFMRTRDIQTPVVDNRRFNYYIMAFVAGNPEPAPDCPECSIGSCRVGYEP